MKTKLAALLALLLVVPAPVASYAATPDTPPGCLATEPLKIMTVGDSITAGATMTSSTSDAYRAELGRLLEDACRPAEFIVAAVGGTTCGYWSSRLADLMTTHNPDIVLIACGTNDRLDNKTAQYIANWEGMYRSLFDTVLDIDPDVLVWPAFVQYSANHGTTACTTPPGPSPNWLRLSEAKGNDAKYRAMVNVIDEWKQRVPEFIDYQIIPEGYLDACGVHPTPAGYNVMGRIAYAAIAKKLNLHPRAIPCGLTGRRDGYPVPNWVECEDSTVRL